MLNAFLSRKIQLIMGNYFGNSKLNLYKIIIYFLVIFMIFSPNLLFAEWDLIITDDITQYELTVAEKHKSTNLWLKNSYPDRIIVKRDNPHLYGFIPQGGPIGSSKPAFVGPYEYVDWEWKPNTPFLRVRRHSPQGFMGHKDKSIKWTSTYELELPSRGSKEKMQFWFHRGMKLMTDMYVDVDQNYYRIKPGQEALQKITSKVIKIMLDPEVIVIPVAIVSFTNSQLYYNFGPEVETLIDFMPSSDTTKFNLLYEENHDDNSIYIFQPSKGRFPHPKAIGLPPDDIFSKCKKPIQFQSVGHWTIRTPRDWRPLGTQCPNHKYANWLPGYADGIHQEIANAYADKSIDFLEYINRVFGPKENGGLQPILIRIGPMPVNCAAAYGHTGTDGIDIDATYAMAQEDIRTVLEGNTIAHELGHYLGLWHYNITGNFMHESKSNYMNIMEDQCETIYAKATSLHEKYSTWLVPVRLRFLNYDR